MFLRDSGVLLLPADERPQDRNLNGSGLQFETLDHGDTPAPCHDRPAHRSVGAAPAFTFR
jgi:hypothetical protein